MKNILILTLVSISLVVSNDLWAKEDCDRWLEDKLMVPRIWELSAERQYCRIANALEDIAEALKK